MRICRRKRYSQGIESNQFMEASPIPCLFARIFLSSFWSQKSGVIVAFCLTGLAGTAANTQVLHLLTPSANINKMGPTALNKSQQHQKRPGFPDLLQVVLQRVLRATAAATAPAPTTTCLLPLLERGFVEPDPFAAVRVIVGEEVRGTNGLHFLTCAGLH